MTLNSSQVKALMKRPIEEMVASFQGADELSVVATTTGSTVCHLAVEAPDALERLKALSPFHLDWNAKNKEGQTPLHLAVARPNAVELVFALFEKGAEHSPKDVWGKTPLHYASATGQYNVSMALLEIGANATDEDLLGATPIKLAYKSQGEEAPRLARALELHARGKLLHPLPTAHGLSLLMDKARSRGLEPPTTRDIFSSQRMSKEGPSLGR